MLFQVEGSFTCSSQMQTPFPSVSRTLCIFHGPPYPTIILWFIFFFFYRPILSGCHGDITADREAANQSNDSVDILKSKGPSNLKADLHVPFQQLQSNLRCGPQVFCRPSLRKIQNLNWETACVFLPFSTSPVWRSTPDMTSQLRTGTVFFPEVSNIYERQMTLWRLISKLCLIFLVPQNGINVEKAIYFHHFDAHHHYIV